MDFKKIEKLMTLMRENDVNEVEVEEGDNKIRIKAKPNGSMVSQPMAFAPQAQAPALPADQSSASAPGGDTPKPARSANIVEIRSPFVGTFYESPAPGSDVFVTVGQRIKPGDVLCIIEAMKLMNEIEADASGTIVEICTKNEEPVEYDQVLFLLEK